MAGIITLRLRPLLATNKLKFFHNFSANFSVQSARYCQPKISENTNSEVDTKINIPSAINPLDHEDFFNIRQLVQMKELFENRVYMGHYIGTRNSYMADYLYGHRLGMDIIDLDQTLPLLQDALNIAAHIAFQKGIIMFISRNRSTMPLIEKTAMDCGEYAHCRYWYGGVFTNATIQFGAVTRLPDLCIFIHTLNNVFQQHAGIVNAAKMNIPSIGILDSNCDPRLITYPVPGNDDTPGAIELYCRLFKEAIMKGKERRNEMEQKGLI